MKKTELVEIIKRAIKQLTEEFEHISSFNIKKMPDKKLDELLHKKKQYLIILDAGRSTSELLPSLNTVSEKMWKLMDSPDTVENALDMFEEIYYIKRPECNIYDISLKISTHNILVEDWSKLLDKLPTGLLVSKNDILTNPHFYPRYYFAYDREAAKNFKR